MHLVDSHTTQRSKGERVRNSQSQQWEIAATVPLSTFPSPDLPSCVVHNELENHNSVVTHLEGVL